MKSTYIEVEKVGILSDHYFYVLENSCDKLHVADKITHKLIFKFDARSSVSCLKFEMVCCSTCTKTFRSKFQVYCNLFRVASSFCRSKQIWWLWYTTRRIIGEWSVWKHYFMIKWNLKMPQQKSWQNGCIAS